MQEYTLKVEKYTSEEQKFTSGVQKYTFEVSKYKNVKYKSLLTTYRFFAFLLDMFSFARAHKADETLHFSAANLLLGHVEHIFKISKHFAHLCLYKFLTGSQNTCARLFSPVVFAQHSASSRSQVFCHAGWKQQNFTLFFMQ